MKYTSNHLKQIKNIPTACTREPHLSSWDLHECIRILDLCHDLVILVDGRNGRIKDANQTACKGLGYTRDQLLELRPDAIFSSSVMEVVEDMLRPQGHEYAEMNGELTTASKETLPGEIVLQRIEKDDVLYLAVVTKDISAQVEAQQARYRLQKQWDQARSMEALLVLAGNLAHDFNNLLQIVSGNIQILGMKNKDEHLNRHIRAIDQATITASTLVQRLRSLSRKGRSSEQPVHMNEIIQKTMEQQKQRIPARVRVDLDLDSGLPGMLGHGMHLEQILLNLLDNALDVLDGQGRIRMATSLYQASAGDEAYPDLESGAYVQLIFADNGPGMDPEIQTRIFEPFFTTHKEGQKAGLGMSIVRALVRTHGGHVYCRSAPGQGTRFILFFPVTPETDTPAPSLR